MNNAGVANPQYYGFWVQVDAVVLDSVILIGITFLRVQLLNGQGYLA